MMHCCSLTIFTSITYGPVKSTRLYYRSKDWIGSNVTLNVNGRLTKCESLLVNFTTPV